MTIITFHTNIYKQNIHSLSNRTDFMFNLSLLHTQACLYINFSKYAIMKNQMHIRVCHIHYKLVNKYYFPFNKNTERVSHVTKTLFIQILIDNTNAMECIWFFCKHMKGQNEIFFHFLVQSSNILEKRLDNMIFFLDFGANHSQKRNSPISFHRKNVHYSFVH